jgi:hypothetical protein
MLVFVLLAGAAVAAVVYLERNPAPQRPAAAPAAAPALPENESPPPVESAEPAVAKTPPPVEKPAKAQPNAAEIKTAAKPAAVAPPRSNTAGSTRPVVLEFDKDTYVATESDGSVRIVVERHGSTQQATTFRWNLRSNSAEQGTDFAGIGPGTEQIPAGARTVTLTIPLVSDAIVENTEVFLVEIEPSQPGVTLGERSHAAVIVVDDD